MTSDTLSSDKSDGSLLLHEMDRQSKQLLDKVGIKFEENEEKIDFLDNENVQTYIFEEECYNENLKLKYEMLMDKNK